jgi:hypothetical protein
MGKTMGFWFVVSFKLQWRRCQIIDNLTSTIVAVKILRRLAPENQVGQLGSGETSWMVSLGL